MIFKLKLMFCYLSNIITVIFEIELNCLSNLSNMKVICNWINQLIIKKGNQ
jgi:hypothetical protein